MSRPVRQRQRPGLDERSRHRPLDGDGVGRRLRSRGAHDDKKGTGRNSVSGGPEDLKGDVQTHLSCLHEQHKQLCKQTPNSMTLRPSILTSPPRTR
uniref:Uncharacterized protein n=1 Tax=Mycena chlorophos TaxID=658473 RepID=A0ABQ0LFD2_MYCCL|nr:predicted protein [Mycena chlorophos]